MGDYATTTELADYLGKDEADLTDDASRLIDRAEELLDFVTLDRIDTTEPDQETAAQNATCAQVEYWVQAIGENYDIAGAVENFSVGNLQMTFSDNGGSVMAPRAYRHLRNWGMIDAYVNQRPSTTQEWIAGDPRIE